MKTCAFFGHGEIWENIDEKLADVLIDLVEKKEITEFYVGNQGAFDKIVLDGLRDLKKRYEFVHYFVVLAYIPSPEIHFDYETTETIYPEELEKTLPKYAIIKRNQWMIGQADVVVTYVKYPFGGAAKAKEYAEKKGKIIINIAECFY